MGEQHTSWDICGRRRRCQYYKAHSRPPEASQERRTHTSSLCGLYQARAKSLHSFLGGGFVAFVFHFKHDRDNFIVGLVGFAIDIVALTARSGVIILFKICILEAP